MIVTLKAVIHDGKVELINARNRRRSQYGRRRLLKG